MRFRPARRHVVSILLALGICAVSQMSILAADNAPRKIVAVTPEQVQWFTTALALSIAASRTVQAAPTEPTNAEIDATEQGIPASIDYPNRMTPPRATNDEIDAAEKGLPASTDYQNRPTPSRSTNDEINAAERWNPDSPDYKDRPAP